MKSAYPRLVEAIQTQSLIAVQDALTELRAIYQTCHGPGLCGKNATTLALNWDLVNARSEDDLTPIAALCYLYAQKKLKGDKASCDRLDAIAGWLIVQGADPFLDQARPLVAGRRGLGRNIVQVFGQANLPASVQAVIDQVNDATEEAEALSVRRFIRQQASRKVTFSQPLVQFSA